MTVKSKSTKLLLLVDVDNLGRSGDIVTVKPGFARNFLLPMSKAVIADARSLRIQGRLQEERAKQAALDKEQSEIIASRVEGITITKEVKVDPEGNLYGSVGVLDIVKMLEGEGIAVDKKSVLLPRSIKRLGVFSINLRLPEGVESSFNLKILSEDGEEEVEVGEEAQS